MLFTVDQDMIQAIAPQRPDQPLNVRILPGRPRRDRAIANPRGSNTPCEGQPAGAIIVAHQPGRSRVPRKGLDDLLRKPYGGRISGHCEPEQLPSAHDEKCKQALEGHRGHDEQVDRCDGISVIAQKCSPTLRRAANPDGSNFRERQALALLACDFGVYLFDDVGPTYDLILQHLFDLDGIH